MLAITVKYLSPTNHKPARLKAFVAGNTSFSTVTVNRNLADSIDFQVREVAQLLEAKIAEKYNRPANRMYGFEYTPDVWIFHKQFD